MRSVVDRNVVMRYITVVLRLVKLWPVYSLNVRTKYTLFLSQYCAAGYEARGPPFVHH